MNTKGYFISKEEYTELRKKSKTLDKAREQIKEELEQHAGPIKSVEQFGKGLGLSIALEILEEVEGEVKQNEKEVNKRSLYANN